MTEKGVASDRPDDNETAAPTEREWRFVIAALRVLGWFLVATIALVVVFVGYLHTPPGRQFMVDQIAQVAPASGLTVEVGEIDGSILWSSTLRDVKFRDANENLFLEVPIIDLNWRPHKWFASGLDVRHLVLTDGTLYAVPELIAGDPDAPILPDFDIQIDRFAIVNLTVADGLLGEERVIDFAAETNIRDGLVYLDAGGEFGGGDVFSALVHAEPDGDHFDLDLDWQAPQGGFLAAMVGAQSDLSVQLEGDGNWTSWAGELDAVQGGTDLLDFEIYNDSGQYRIVGRARPGTYVEGLAARALGETVMLTASGSLEDSVLEGEFVLRARGVNADGAGAIDLANNSFGNVQLAAQLLDPTLFSEGAALNGANIEATLNGAFRDLNAPHRLTVAEIDLGGITVSGVTQEGALTYDGTRITVPVDADIQRIVSGAALFDPRLVNGTLGGTLVYAGRELRSDNLAVNFPGIEAQLGLNSNFANGLTQVTGPVNLADLPFDGIGTIDAGAQIRFAIGGGAPWSLNADLQGRVDEVTNSTLANLAGSNIRFAGGLSLGSGTPVAFDNMRITASKVSATLDGSVEAGTTTLAGSGRHVDYGPFTVEAMLADDGPRAALVFADPLPAAGLNNVRVVLAPNEDGFAIDTQGGSLLGAFDGQIFLNIAENGDTFIDINRLDVAESRVSGVLQLIEGGVVGDLNLSQGGINGTVGLAVRDGGQGFDIDVTARNARFGGDTPLTINRGTIDATGLIGADSTSVQGNASLQGLSYGSIFVGRMAAHAQLVDGIGQFDAALTGRRGSRFELDINGNASAERIAVAVEGSYAGRDISMPRRAVLDRLGDGGWQLQRSQLSFGNGYLLASGRTGGDAPMSGNVSLANMPLGLADVLAGELGVGGTVSGVLEFAGGVNGLPTGEARLMIEDLTRASALLTSSPMDIAVVANLSETLAQARAVISDGGSADGRLQGRIANLPQSGSLIPRLYAGDLFAQLRFDGDAAALWRLAAIDLLDVTGDVEVAADLRGSLGDPQVAGSISGDTLRVRSGLTGTDLTGVSVRGRFNGSRFNLASFAGTAPNGGRVSGSGFIDLSGITASRGPSMDIRIAANDAEILDIANMGATITGPMRIVSNGLGGTIAGRLRANDVRWRLGVTAEAIAQLPSINTTQINLPGDVAPIAVSTGPWRYLIDVRAPGGIQVDGLGLESEWRTDNLQIRGTADDPRLGGEVSVVPRQGFYSFAGTRFEITQGDIFFDANIPIDPRIDLVAETEVDALSVTVNVRGNGSQPEIIFSSTPALPEEELLARLLFGGSIANLSATDALQLGAAMASLRGGSGVGPINRLRNAIGLDRLRIVAADPALDRGTSVALGKNLGRRFYVEIITDGAGYSASNLEYRVTSWINLLATVSTVGRNSAAVEYRRDY